MRDNNTLDLFVGRPTARQSDPETSHEAADSVSHRTETQIRLWRLMEDCGGATDEWLFLNWDGRISPSGLRTRRHELVEMGYVEWTGDTERMTTGRMGRVWRTTVAGRKALLG